MRIRPSPRRCPQSSRSTTRPTGSCSHTHVTSSRLTTACARRYTADLARGRRRYLRRPRRNAILPHHSQGRTAMLSSSLVRSVLDSLPDAIVIVDSSGNILFANHQVEALFGFGSEEIVGGPVEVLLPE